MNLKYDIEVFCSWVHFTKMQANHKQYYTLIKTFIKLQD